MNTRLSLIVLAALIVSAAARAADDPTQPRRPEVCSEQYSPVCAEKDGARQTYSNACFAQAAQAALVSEGQCPEAK
jgi:hypothetical protein